MPLMRPQIIFPDSVTTLANITDSTKQLVFSLGGMTTGITDTISTSITAARTHTLPNVTGTLLSTGAAQTVNTSAAPAGTISTTAVMMAVGGAITPLTSTRVFVVISGQMANNTINDGATVDLRYGTGTAPINGAAVSGTLVGVSQTVTALIAGEKSGFCIHGIISGLTIGTAIWIDASLLAVTGGTATITGVTISAHEI